VLLENHLLLEIANAPLPKRHEQLLTLGITEPFSTTLTVSAYAAIILALPFVLYELYGFLLPASAKFLLNFNDSQFNVQVAGDRQGRTADQEPALRLPRLCGRRRGAAGCRPVSMLLKMAPLIVLYEISIVLAKVFGTPAERVDAAPQGS
jgi:Sec-independent protein secretion pathway component TatC